MIAKSRSYAIMVSQVDMTQAVDHFYGMGRGVIRISQRYQAAVDGHEAAVSHWGNLRRLKA